MRGIYLKYSNSANRSIEDIKKHIIKLNTMVKDFSLQQIKSKFDMHTHYLNEISTLPDPTPLPKNTDFNNYTYDLSRRNDMNYNIDEKQNEDDAANILLFSS